MSDITDAQTLSIYNAQGKPLPAALNPQGGSAIVETIVSGTAFQVSAKRNADLYINIVTSSAITIAMGPVVGNEIVVAASQSAALGVTTLRVPTGWLVTITGTVANFVATAVLI